MQMKRLFMGDVRKVRSMHNPHHLLKVSVGDGKLMDAVPLHEYY